MNAPLPAIAPVDEAFGAVGPLDRSNVLIVDDRLDKRVVFRTILEELDQNIVTASSGEEALRWLLDNECAVILLDVNMPGMDGLETAELMVPSLADLGAGVLIGEEGKARARRSASVAGGAQSLGGARETFEGEFAPLQAEAIEKGVRVMRDRLCPAPAGGADVLPIGE